VEMKSDSFRGRSEEIRTTRHLPEHFSERNFYEHCVCTWTFQSTSYALYSGDCSLIAQGQKGKGSTPYSFYHQALRTTKGHLHPTLDTWSGYRQFRHWFGSGR